MIAARSHGLPLYLDLAVLRFLEIRRTGRRPRPADFDFPALIARTLSDLTPEERHVLCSVTLLDSFDLALASPAAGMTHEAPALRLIERPFVQRDDFALWSFHLHALIRSTIRTADDQTDYRWSPRDWQHAAERTLAALGEQWTTSPARDRQLLIGCLRQGLALAADFGLNLGWLTGAAWSYISDSVWEPLTPPARPPDRSRPPRRTPWPTPWSNCSTPSAAASTNTANAPSSAWPRSPQPGCCPLTFRRWAPITGPRPNATSATAKPPAKGCNV